MGIQPKTMTPGTSVKKMKEELTPMKKGGATKPSYKKGGSTGKKKMK